MLDIHLAMPHPGSMNEHIACQPTYLPAINDGGVNAEAGYWCHDHQVFITLVEYYTVIV